MREYYSSSHTKWECKYHVMFIPKCPRKTLYVDSRCPPPRRGFAAAVHSLFRHAPHCVTVATAPSLNAVRNALFVLLLSPDACFRLRALNGCQMVIKG